MAYPETWSGDSCLIAITALGGSDIEFSGITESVDIDTGDKEYENLPNVAGGRLEKPKPEEDTVITFEGYPVSLDTSAEDVDQRFYTQRTGWDTTGPGTSLGVSNTKYRDKFRVVILFTDLATVSSATAAVASAAAKRRTYINCRLVSMKVNYTDGVEKYTFKFRVAPFNASGTANVTIESVDGTGTLAALAAYT